MKRPDATAIEIPIALKAGGRPPSLLSSARARSEMLSLRSMAGWMVPLTSNGGIRGTIIWSIVRLSISIPWANHKRSTIRQSETSETP